MSLSHVATLKIPIIFRNYRFANLHSRNIETQPTDAAMRCVVRGRDIGSAVVAWFCISLVVSPF